jgi:hypothetical protein
MSFPNVLLSPHETRSRPCCARLRSPASLLGYLQFARETLGRDSGLPRAPRRRLAAAFCAKVAVGLVAAWLVGIVRVAGLHRGAGLGPNAAVMHGERVAE